MRGKQNAVNTHFSLHSIPQKWYENSTNPDFADSDLFDKLKLYTPENVSDVLIDFISWPLLWSGTF